MPISEFREKLDAAVNIFNGYRLGKFELLSPFDKKQEFLNEIEYFRRKGRLN